MGKLRLTALGIGACLAFAVAVPSSATTTATPVLNLAVHGAPAAHGAAAVHGAAGPVAAPVTATRHSADSARGARNVPVHAAGTQTSPPWGLDRIDQSSLPLDGRFTTRRSGAGVTVYVIDSGIDPTNPDLKGRVTKGKSFIRDAWGTRDCNGHGTQVAGVIGGTVYGVAKRATLVPVRVLDCSGNGDAFTTARAVDWLVSHHRRGVPAVANLSLSGPYSRAENEAVRRLVADGVTVVTAAGNNGADACSYSPGSVPEALTVAASDQDDQKVAGSNHGPCIDLYAPGEDIAGAPGTGRIAVYRSGTSMSAPHVAGVAALILARHHGWSPARVGTLLLRLSLRGAVSGSPDGTPNRLLNIAPTITAITPGHLPLRKSTTVTITGRGFSGVEKVTFNGVAGTRLKVVSDTKLTVRAPARRSEKTVTVVATTALSSSDRSLRVTYSR